MFKVDISEKGRKDHLYFLKLIYVDMCKEYAIDYSNTQCAKIIHVTQPTIINSLKNIDNLKQVKDPSAPSYYRNREIVINTIEEVIDRFKVKIDKEIFYDLNSVIDYFQVKIDKKNLELKRHKNKALRMATRKEYYKNKYKSLAELKLAQ